MCCILFARLPALVRLLHPLPLVCSLCVTSPHPPLPIRLRCPPTLLPVEMSAPPNSNGGKQAKRKTQADTATTAELAATDDRVVRQRMDLTHTSAPTPTHAHAAAAASLSPPSTPPSVCLFLRLAVVERQLVMQGCDLRSLARLASTCRQMRGEALDKEAGKFIPRPPQWEDSLHRVCFIHQNYPAHDSPLFRKHAPMTLTCHGDRPPRDDQSLVRKTALFSRVASFRCFDMRWTEVSMLQLLRLPCMQYVKEVHMRGSSHWIDRPLVQAALFRLPRLESFHMWAGPDTKLLPSAIARALKLSTVQVEGWNAAAAPGSLRALRLAPALANLSCNFSGQVLSPALVWCLPPTLTELRLRDVDMARDLSCPLLKALFSRTPLLASLQLESVSIEAILRGFLDAGVAAPQSLRSVEFEHMRPDDLSVGVVPDPLEPIFRRFVHRFPQVIVRINCEEGSWDEPDELDAVLLRYSGWQAVVMSVSAGSQLRMGGPPSPHPSDDDVGSDVEDLEEPAAGDDRSSASDADSSN